MKVSKSSNQAKDLENNIFKLSKCNKLSKTKSADKTRNIKKTNILKSLDCIKAIKKSKKENIKCVVPGKKRKCAEINEHNSKSKEYKRFANNINYSIKENIKKQFHDTTDKLKIHNYSKSPKECKYQENAKKKAKLKQQILNVKNNKLKKQHNSNVSKEKKQKTHLKGIKERKTKLNKHKDHNLNLNKKSKMKRNHLKESKQSCLNIQNKVSNKSLYEQLSKMKLSSGSSSDKEVPAKKKKEVICNGTLYNTMKKNYKEKQQNFIPNKKLKSRTFEENIPPQEISSNVSPAKAVPTSAPRCHRVASLNAIAKVHILFENEFRNCNNNEKKDDVKRKLSTSFSKHNVSLPKQELDKKAGKEIKAKMQGKKNMQQTKNMNIVSVNKEEQLNKQQKPEENELNGTRRSKRMASMNAQAILAVTCSLRPRRKNTKIALPENISVSSTESDMTEIQVKWSSEKVHQEVNNKSNSSTSYQSKVVIMGVRSTRTLKADQLKNHLKDMKKNKSKLGKKKPVRKDDDNLVQNNLCSYHAVASDDNMAVSRLGLTKYTKVTKVHINTKGMDLKATEDSNLHEIEQGEMAVMSTYRYQTKDSYHHWQTMFSKPVPGQLSNQTDADCNGCCLANPTHSYSYPTNSGPLAIPGVGVDEARDCCIGGCDSSSPVPCNVDRCGCQQNDPYFQRIIDPFCSNKSVYTAQPSCLNLPQQSSNLICCSREQNASQEAHHTNVCKRQETLCSADQCHQQLPNFQTHYKDSSNLNNQSCQQTYPSRYSSYNVHCHRTCQLHKFSLPCHGCTTPNHIHRSHIHSCLNYQKALSSHNQDICPPAPHSPNPHLAAPTSDSAASLAAKVPRSELLMPQEANLPTEGKLSIEDGSYKYCLSCQATVCENDRNMKCVPSSRSSLLNQDSVDNSESIYFNSTPADKQRLKSTVADIQLSHSGKINNCKIINEKISKKHQLEHKYPPRKSFKFLKLNQKWRRSESPEDDIPLCNLNKQQVSTCFSQLDNGIINEDSQKSTKKHKKHSLSRFSNNKKLCHKDTDNCIRVKKLEEIIPKLSLHSPIPRRIGKTKYSNGWSWEGEPFEKLVLLSNDDIPRLRKCYSAMRHVEGDVIRVRDCVLLKSGPRKADLPYVAKVVALWENFEDGEMMLSLLWYYRPEHTDQGRTSHHMEDEIFASKHRDINSVACIEDKCYVLTFGEYCRYRAWLKMLEEGTRPKTSPVPDMEECYIRKDRLPPGRVSSEMIFFCHKVYDFRQRRILKNPT